LLSGQNAVEACEHERRSTGRILLQRIDQLERQTRGADGVGRATDGIELPQPIAESCGILIPCGARLLVQQLRSVDADEAVRFHGQSGEPVARAGDARRFGSGSRNDSGPERVLLQGIQNDAAICAALIPCGASECMPILNERSLPGSETFGAARTVVGERKRPCGALAGRDHQPALAQPCVDALFRSSPHYSFIR